MTDDDETPREILARMGLSPDEAADLLGIGVRSVRRWFEPGHQMSEPSRRLLILIDEMPGVKRKLQRMGRARAKDTKDD